MNANVLAVVNVRMGSSRMPGKSMVDIFGRPLLEHVVRRLWQSNSVRKIVIATTTESEDDPICRLAVSLNVNYVRGHPFNVVSRMDDAVRAYAVNGDFVFRAMSDQPFLDWQSLDYSTKLMHVHDWDFTLPLTFGADPVYGAGLSAWSMPAWQWIVSMSSGDELEHPGLRLRRDLSRFQYGLVDLPHWAFRPYRLEVDEPDDVRLVRSIWTMLGSEEEPTLRSVVQFLDQHREMSLVNANVQEKTGTYTTFTQAEIHEWERDYAGRRVVFTDFPSAVGVLTSKAATCSDCGGFLVTTKIGSDKVRFVCPFCGHQRVYRR